MIESKAVCDTVRITYRINQSSQETTELKSTIKTVIGLLEEVGSPEEFYWVVTGCDPVTEASGLSTFSRPDFDGITIKGQAADIV